MYSNDSAALGVATVAAPAVLGVAFWPDFTLIIIGIAFVLLGSLYFAYKLRMRRRK